MSERLRFGLLAAIVAIYLVFGTAYAVKTPSWETPDEPAHFNYAHHLAERLQFPVLQVGDYDHAYLEKLTASRFPPNMSVESLRYESWQPPLYYLLSVPLHWAGRTLPQFQQVIVLRLFSVFLGGVLLLVSYRIARRIFPQDDLLALAVPGFIATLPQHIAMTAAVSNDTLAEVVLSLILLVLVGRYCQQTSLGHSHPDPLPLREREGTGDRFRTGGVQGRRRWWQIPSPFGTGEGRRRRGPRTLKKPSPFPKGEGRVRVLPSIPATRAVGNAAPRLSHPLPLREREGMASASGRGTRGSTVVLGLLLGAALLTKTTIYVGTVLIPFGLLLREYVVNRQPPLSNGRRILGVAGESAVVFAIALVISGWWFVRNALVYGDFDLFGWQRHDLVVQGQPLTESFSLAYARFFAMTTFKSFWAMFGWMGVAADEGTYALLGALTAVAVVGLGLFLLRVVQQRSVIGPYEWPSLALMGATFALVFGVLVAYNFRFIQAQGRYLFPALIPIAIFLTLGLREIVSPRYASIAFALLYLALLALDYIALTRFILPQLVG